MKTTHTHRSGSGYFYVQSLDNFARLWRIQPMLILAVMVNIGLLALGLFGLVVDARTVLNAPVWAKTVKFSLSVIAYCGTLAWMMAHMQRAQRLARTLGGLIGAILIAEMSLMVTQAIRGVPMHFNVSTPLDTALYSIMGTGITVMWVLTAVVAIAMLREHTASPTLTTGIRLGLALALIGMALAFLMTSPNATQMAALEAGRKVDMIGAHNVNAMIDGQTRMIPLLGWNMDGGDLRIAHFVGIHGLQIAPLAALWIDRRWAQLSVRRRAALVWTAATGYLGLTLLTVWQALRDQSIIAPDALTLGALAALIIATAVSARLITRTASAK
jgi:hypothetical protein